MSALPSSKKTHSEKHKLILKQLLKEPANKVCVDCKTSAHPRWASWNLGCFMCIRCSGIHRSMGTHISRVKSVDLDAWTDEQVESMVRWGNAKCNGFWEAKLPEGYVPDSLKIENFIRTKYDMKKWAASATVPDPRKVAAPPAPTAPPAATAPTVPPAKAKPTPASSGLLLDDDFGVFTSSQLHPAPPAPPARSSAPPQVQPAAAARVDPRTAGRQDLKKSILSLYSSPSSSSGHVPSATPNAGSGSASGVADSLAGLSFGPASASTSSFGSASSAPKPQWNEWSSDGDRSATPSYTAPAARSTPLDDELFKNVWS